jgi:hypothetical protein
MIGNRRFPQLPAALAVLVAGLFGCSSPDAIRYDPTDLDLDRGPGAGDLVFDGFDEIKVEAFLHWRPDTGGQRVALAFRENFEQLVGDLVDAAGVELPLCRDDCGQRALVIQFKETGYDIALGDNTSESREIRGTLRFIDRDSHQVVAERAFIDVDSHRELFGRMHRELSDRALTLSQHHGPSVGGGREELLATAIEDLNRVSPVGVRYAGVLD